MELSHQSVVRLKCSAVINQVVFYCGFLFSDRQNDKLQIYNLSQVGTDRKWLQDILLSDLETEPEITDEDEYIHEILKDHVKEKKIREKYYQNSHVSYQNKTSIL